MAHKSPEDDNNKRTGPALGFRQVLEYLLGIVFIVVGIFSFYRFKGDNTMIVFGVVAILYGLWRLYKAFKRKGY